MENFGLITYIDNGLLMDPNTPEASRVGRENGIAGLIAHGELQIYYKLP
jgi:aminopeptidase N